MAVCFSVLAVWVFAQQPPPMEAKRINWNDRGDGWIEVNWVDSPGGRWSAFRSNAVLAMEVNKDDPLTRNTTLRVYYAGGSFRFDMLSRDRAHEFATFIAAHK